MSERIRINYTIKFDDMQAEIRRLFGNVVSELDCADYSVPPDVLSMSALETIKEMRSFAYDIEQNLADIETLIKSYLQYTTKPPDVQPDANESLEQLSTLKTVLESLQLPDGDPNEITD